MGAAPIIAPPLTATTGSLFFDGTTSHLQYAPSQDFDIGTADFTVEWFQWRLETTQYEYRRVFSMGTGGSCKFAVSHEDGTIFVYSAAGALVATTIALQNKKWHHIAVARTAGVVRLIVNGVVRASTVSSDVFGDSSTVLTIGSETTSSPAMGRFSGWISNFRFVKGTGLYNASPVVPTAPLTAVGGSSLLLLANTSQTALTDSATAKTASVVSNVGWRGASPFA